MNAPNQTLICNPQIEWSELHSVSFQPFRICSCLNVCVQKKERKERKRKNAQSQLPGFELALFRQLLAWRAWNFTTRLKKQNTRYCVTITRPAVWEKNTSHAVSKANKGKKVKLILQLSFAKKKLKRNWSWPSMADFRDVESVLPCNPTNNGKKNLCGCAKTLMDRENLSRSPFSS